MRADDVNIPIAPSRQTEAFNKPRLVTSQTIALILVSVAFASYALLFTIMWVPVRGGANEGWLFLFPIFLLAWIPTEAVALAGLVLAVIALAKQQGRRSVSTVLAALALVFVVLSLPLLWFGTFPFFLLNPLAWSS